MLLVQLIILGAYDARNERQSSQSNPRPTYLSAPVCLSTQHLLRGRQRPVNGCDVGRIPLIIIDGIPLNVTPRSRYRNVLLCFLFPSFNKCELAHVLQRQTCHRSLGKLKTRNFPT